MKYISICIVASCGLEVLPRCLESIRTQDFDDYEVIVVDASDHMLTGESGRDLSWIAGYCSSTAGMDIRHAFVPSEYGKLEAVRKAVMKADGLYVLMLEPQDTLCPHALSSLHDLTCHDHPDIVEGNIRCQISLEPADGNASEVLDGLSRMESLVNSGRTGLLFGSDILEEFLSARSCRGCLTGRIIRTELMLSSLRMLSSQYAVHGYDYLIYFSAAYLAQSFLRTDTDVYVMRIGNDAAQGRRISTLRDWEHICLASSMYSSIYGILMKFRKNFSDEEFRQLEETAYFHLVQSVIELEKSVSEDVKPKAWKMLRDFWGEDVFDSVLADLRCKGIIDLKSSDSPQHLTRK